MQRQGKNLVKLRRVMQLLQNEEQLDPLRRDHKLRGTFQGSRECHIESDWLLIYALQETKVIFERTGSHAELFE